MNEDYDIGVWDVVLDLNLSNESLKEACETDAPTCVMVFRLHSNTGGTHANPHQSPECRLCHMIETYATRYMDTSDTVSYARK